MATYIVQRAVEHDGVRHEIGAEVTDEQLGAAAESLLALGRIVEREGPGTDGEVKRRGRPRKDQGQG